MKLANSHRHKSLATVALIVSAVTLGFLSTPTSAAPTHQFSLSSKIGQLKQKFGPAYSLNQTLFNVKLPLNISNMPGAWKKSILIGTTVVYFLNGPGDVVGYSTSTDGGEGMQLNIGLSNGGYNGTIVFPINKTAGAITGKTCGYAMVLARLGSQYMFIGGSSGGTAPQSGPCSNINLPTPGTIIAN